MMAEERADGAFALVRELRELRDLLKALDRKFDDQIDRAFSIQTRQGILEGQYGTMSQRIDRLRTQLDGIEERLKEERAPSKV